MMLHGSVAWLGCMILLKTWAVFLCLYAPSGERIREREGSSMSLKQESGRRWQHAWSWPRSAPPPKGALTWLNCIFQRLQSHQRRPIVMLVCHTQRLWSRCVQLLLICVRGSCIHFLQHDLLHEPYDRETINTYHRHITERVSKDVDWHIERTGTARFQRDAVP